MSETFFNCILEGPAYLNEIKYVTPTKGKPYIAIKAALLEGLTDQPNKQFVDLIVVGDHAKTWLDSLKDYWPQGYGHDGPSWFSVLRIGSVGVKPYLSKQDNTARAVLSGRLIRIDYLKVGDTVQLPPVNAEAA